MTELEKYFAKYEPTAEINDRLWGDFTQKTDSIEFLKSHRDWVEKNSWGFGDRAFHYMWYLLLRDDVLKRDTPRLLEIGVYKGQVISLWSLVAHRLGCPVQICGVSPFQGNKPWFAKNRILNRLACLIAKHYRDNVRSASLYECDDYLEAVHRIFKQFVLSEENVTLLRGYSQDEHILRQLSSRHFDVIYIDGGHRYEEVLEDLNCYSRLASTGGYLVLDDASCNQPGSKFWKGHGSVSRAAEEWGATGFRNILNVGHNRIYKRSF